MAEAPRREPPPPATALDSRAVPGPTTPEHGGPSKALSGNRRELLGADRGLAVGRTVLLDPRGHVEAAERALAGRPEVAEADLLAGGLHELPHNALVDLGLVDLEGDVELPVGELGPHEADHLATVGVATPPLVDDPLGVVLERQEELLDRQDRGEDRRLGGADLLLPALHQSAGLGEAAEQVERGDADRAVVVSVQLGRRLVLGGPVGPLLGRRPIPELIEQLFGGRVHQQGRNAPKRCEHTDHRVHLLGLVFTTQRASRPQTHLK